MCSGLIQSYFEANKKKIAYKSCWCLSLEVYVQHLKRSIATFCSVKLRFVHCTLKGCQSAPYTFTLTIFRWLFICICLSRCWYFFSLSVLLAEWFWSLTENYALHWFVFNGMAMETNLTRQWHANLIWLSNSNHCHIVTMWSLCVASLVCFSLWNGRLVTRITFSIILLKKSIIYFCLFKFSLGAPNQGLSYARLIFRLQEYSNVQLLLNN